MGAERRGAVKRLTRVLLRFWRWIIDLTVDWVIWMTVRPQRGVLPPVGDQVLLVPAFELARKIRTKQVTSESVVRAYIDRINKVQPLINAIVDERFADALAEARQVDTYLRTCSRTSEEIEKEQPLLGVPFTVKGNLSCKGLFLDVGMLSRKGRRAEDDAVVVTRMRAAGAIPLALTNQPEMAMSFSCYNLIHGYTKNPFDTSLSPGGSSGGEAALLTSSGSILGLGNDLLGSLRIPACLTGIFSHKPSGGIVPTFGLYPYVEEALRNVVSIGPMCRYASDLLPALKILTQCEHNKLRLDKQVDLKEVKIYFATDPVDHPLVPTVNPDVEKAVVQVVHHLEKLTSRTATELKVSEMAHSCWMFATITSAKVKRKLRSYLSDQVDQEVDVISEFAKSFFGLSKHTFFPMLFCMMELIIPKKGSEQYEAYARMLDKAQKILQKILDEQNAVWILPSFPQSSLHHLESTSKYHALNYFAIFNVLGLPVTQVPIGVGAGGYPIGVQVVGGRYNDHLTIAVAEQLENAFGGWVSPSPVAV